MGAITLADIEAAHPELAGSAVTISWNNGRSKKSRTSSSLLTNPSFVRMNALVADPLMCCSSRPPLIKQFEHPMHFFYAIEITGWSSRQPRNDAEVFINIGIGGRILSDFIAGDYLNDFLSIRFCLASVRLAADHS